MQQPELGATICFCSIFLIIPLATLVNPTIGMMIGLGGVFVGATLFFSGQP